MEVALRAIFWERGWRGKGAGLSLLYQQDGKTTNTKEQLTCKAIKSALLPKNFSDKPVVLVLPKAVAVSGDHASTVLTTVLEHEQALVYFHTGVALSLICHQA